MARLLRARTPGGRSGTTSPHPSRHPSPVAWTTPLRPAGQSGAVPLPDRAGITAGLCRRQPGRPVTLADQRRAVAPVWLASPARAVVAPELSHQASGDPAALGNVGADQRRHGRRGGRAPPGIGADAGAIALLAPGEGDRLTPLSAGPRRDSSGHPGPVDSTEAPTALPPAWAPGRTEDVAPPGGPGPDSGPRRGSPGDPPASAGGANPVAQGPASDAGSSPVRSWAWR